MDLLLLDPLPLTSYPLWLPIWSHHKVSWLEPRQLPPSSRPALPMGIYPPLCRLGKYPGLSKGAWSNRSTSPDKTVVHTLQAIGPLDVAGNLAM